jgi:hypothetical protein
MPGHSQAALSCYPHLSCTEKNLEIYPFFQGPGITKDIYCAGKEETFAFLEKVLAEVFEIFPSPYIHIGGDEVPKERWKACGKCRNRMEKEGLGNEEELQSYFIKRIGKFIEKRGRVLLGWDEILEGGLAPDAAVMSWRGTKGGIAAAKQGHKVVMSPTTHCYFDYPYSRIDTARAYSFEPVPEELSDREGEFILGLQANFWSHIDREPEKVDAMLFPRLLSIAERGWSPKETRQWKHFQWRVKIHKVYLDGMGIHYRRAPVEEPPYPVARWAPDQMSEEYIRLSWDISKHIQGPGRYRVRFRYTRGSHRIGIEEAALLKDGVLLSIDTHRGEAGTRHLENDYSLSIDTLDPKGRYILRAKLRSEGGTDSYGEIYLLKEK